MPSEKNERSSDWELLNSNNGLLLVHYCSEAEYPCTTILESKGKRICQGCKLEAPKSKTFIVNLSQGKSIF